MLLPIAKWRPSDVGKTHSQQRQLSRRWTQALFAASWNSPPSIAPRPNSGCFCHFFLDCIDREGWNFCAARRHGAEMESRDHGSARSHGFTSVSIFGRHRMDLDLDERLHLAQLARGIKGFTHGKQADGDGDDRIPSVELLNAEARLARLIFRYQPRRWPSLMVVPITRGSNCPARPRRW